MSRGFRRGLGEGQFVLLGSLNPLKKKKTLWNAKSQRTMNVCSSIPLPFQRHQGLSSHSLWFTLSDYPYPTALHAIYMYMYLYSGCYIYLDLWTNTIVWQCMCKIINTVPSMFFFFLGHIIMYLLCFFGEYIVPEI